MKLTVWTYEGPPHVGAMRIATALRDVHYVLHAPQGDTYADLLFTMIERLPRRPPVTYTTFQARDLGADTAELFQNAVRDAYERFRPQALLVGASCTAELIQDDPGGLARALELPVPVVPLELPSYQRKENWGASETFYQLVRALVGTRRVERAPREGRRPRCNLLGPCALGFRHRDDVPEVRQLLDLLDVEVSVVAPQGASVADLARLPEADFNVVLYPEVAQAAAQWLQRTHGQPLTTVVPIGSGATRDFLLEVARLAGVDPAPALARPEPRARWYARSVDSNYLTGKRVFVFGDATHAIAAARVASEELGFQVVGLGSYAREFARELRAAAQGHGLEALLSDDYLEVEAAIESLQPDLVLGTQMERHIAKRLGIPCAVISAPAHVQDFPSRYAPQMGDEGANVLFDTWVQPLMMGLEEHLLGMFREDFEFHADAAPSHLGAAAARPAAPAAAHAEGTTLVRDEATISVRDGASASVRDEASTAVRDAASTAVRDAASTAVRAELVEAQARASTSSARTVPANASAPLAEADAPIILAWDAEAEAELRKIPFFVRGKARRNTERYASECGLALITLETLYDAKAHFAR